MDSNILFEFMYSLHPSTLFEYTSTIMELQNLQLKSKSVLCTQSHPRFDTDLEHFNSDNVNMHITNQALNQQFKSFEVSNDPTATATGSRWFLFSPYAPSFFRNIQGYRNYLKEQGIDDVVVWERIKDVVVRSMLSVEPQITPTVDNLVKHR